MEAGTSRSGSKTLLLLTLLTLFAFLVRVWRIWDHGLCQWDEGVYALSARWLSTLGDSGTLGSPSHGPPLYTLLLAGLFSLLGDTDRTILLASVAAGTAIAPTLFFLGRCWFGEKEGWVAAFLWCSIPIGVLYSRRGLTDIWFTLFFLLGVWTVSARPFRGWRDLWIFLPAAAAMLTKYHGAGVMIVALGVAVACRVAPKNDEDRWPPLTLGKVIWGFGFLGLALSPWILFLLLEWDLLRLVRNYGSYSGASFTVMDRIRILAWGVGWFFIASAVLGVSRSLARRRAGDLWLLASIGFFVLVILAYRPYPRLFLPLSAFGCLASGLAIVWVSKRFPEHVQTPAAVTFSLLVFASFVPSDFQVALQTCNTYREGAAIINDLSVEKPLYVCAQQPLVYYLNRESRSVLDPEYSNLEETHVEFFLVADHWIERYPKTQGLLGKRQTETVFEQDLNLPEDVLMNSRNLDSVLERRSTPDEEGLAVTLYLVHGAEAP